MIRFIVLLLAIAADSSGATEWSHFGANASGNRFASASQITPDNVAGLGMAWQFRTGDAARGDDYSGRDSSFKATPILFDGKLIFSTGFNRVFAVHPETGEQIWRFDPEVDFSINYSEMFTSRGVSAWVDRSGHGQDACKHRVYLGTLDARLIALDATNGRKCRHFGEAGEIDLANGIRNFRRGQYSLTSPITVINDILVVGSSIGDNGGVELEPGVVRAFDARSGRQLWQWDPIPRAANAPGGRTWNDDGGRKNGGANVWSVISADESRDLVFLPTTSPAPDFYGGQRLGDNLFANSVVALHAATGEVAWHFQTVHHDLWDYDIAAQPLLTDIDSENASVPVVVQATKMGHVFVLHRETGEPVFDVEEKTVPATDVPGESTAPTQPFPTAPPPLHAGEVRIWDHSPEHAAYCRNLIGDARYEGIFTPPSIGGTLLFPGNGGGTNWGSMAVDPRSATAVLTINRWPTLVRLIPRGEFPDRARRERGGDLDVQFTAQEGTRFGMSRHDIYNPHLLLPCIEGPWSEVVALNLNHGTVLWRAPLGIFPGLENDPEASKWGSLATGGPILTAGGLLFIADRLGRKLLAMNINDGSSPWSATLPAEPTATPMSYSFNGIQYVVIAAGGSVEDSDTPGDYLIAFSLDREGRTSQ